MAFPKLDRRVVAIIFQEDQLQCVSSNPVLLLGTESTCVNSVLEKEFIELCGDL